MTSNRSTLRFSLLCRSYHNSSSNSGPSGGGLNNKFPLTMSQFAVPDKKVVMDQFKMKVYSYMDGYEEFIGIKQVKEAHTKVIHSEMEFMKAQELRRTVQKSLHDIQNKLRDNRADLDRTFRGEDRYLELIKQEIALVREERDVREKFEEYEKNERECFNGLSNALRLSHEKEKAQNEKTKYWSVIGSVVGAVVGIIGTTINSKYKMRQMKQVMAESSLESNNHIQTQLSQAITLLNELKSLDNNNFNQEGVNATPTPAIDTQGTQFSNSSLVLKDIQNFLSKSETLIHSMETLEQNLRTFHPSGTPGPIGASYSSNQISDRNRNSTDLFSTMMLMGVAILFWCVFPADG